MPHPPTHRIGVFAVVFDDQGRALVSRRPDNGYYNLPGGGLEPSESVDEGVIREVREETGLEVTVGRLVGVYAKPQKHEVVLVFTAQIVGGALQHTAEADDHQWLHEAELDALPLLPKHRERLMHAFRHDLAPVVMAQREASVHSLKGA